MDTDYRPPNKSTRNSSIIGNHIGKQSIPPAAAFGPRVSKLPPRGRQAFRGPLLCGLLLVYGSVVLPAPIARAADGLLCRRIDKFPRSRAAMDAAPRSLGADVDSAFSGERAPSTTGVDTENNGPDPPRTRIHGTRRRP